MNQKFIYILSCLLFFILVLSACGQQENEPDCSF